MRNTLHEIQCIFLLFAIFLFVFVFDNLVVVKQLGIQGIFSDEGSKVSRSRRLFDDVVQRRLQVRVQLVQSLFDILGLALDA